MPSSSSSSPSTTSSPTHVSIVGTAATVTSLVVAVVAAGWIYHQQRQISRQEEEDDSLLPPSLPSHIERDMHKEERFKRMLPLLTMKKPMYDNIMMQDPQGNPLSTISMKKAKWYVNKELADWIVVADDTAGKDDPQKDKNNNKKPQQQPLSIIRLRFQPNNNNNNSRIDETSGQTLLFNTSIKANRCVVCGTTDHYMRHYVVPYGYRSLFPDDYKTHLSHDVVLTCAVCHVRAEQHAQRRRRQLERRHRRDPATAQPILVDRHKQNIAKQALALQKRQEQMPAWRIAECQANVRQFWNLGNDEPLTAEMLVQTSEIPCTRPNPQYIPNEVLVVQPLLDALKDGLSSGGEGDDEVLTSFIRGWRAYFLETSQPQYLPKGWSVESAVRCDKNKHKSSRTGVIS
eukprot:scaffold3341_cov171-Amphora_coffeaeformis.AAC.4